MGGGYSLDLAIADPTLKAAVINYGHLASDDATLKKINAAILGIFGGQDKGIPPADVKQIRIATQGARQNGRHSHLPGCRARL